MHMYQCPHPGARGTRTHAFKQMREYLKQNGLSSQISNTFVNMCKSVCNEKEMESIHPPSVDLDETIQSQRNLPNDFILRGFLSIEWFRTLLQHDKSNAEGSMIHLHLCLWKILFTQIRDFRNDELHGRESLIETYERSILKGELTEWKRNAVGKLGTEQAYLVEFNLCDLDKWPMTTMKNTAETLAHAAQNY